MKAPFILRGFFFFYVSTASVLRNFSVSFSEMLLMQRARIKHVERRKEAMKEPCYRHELKYLLSPEKAEILSKRLEKFLPRDPHVRGKGYTIRSLYFDSFNDEALQDNLMGAALREKFRIRLYEEDFTLIRLEKKVKHLSQGFKESGLLTPLETSWILEGRYEFLKEKKERVFMDFYMALSGKLLRPKVIITYDREPFMWEAGNVRITLDRNIRFYRNPMDFLKKNLCCLPDEKEKALLEVKYDGFLPSFIPAILSGENPLQSAHSKYVLGRFALDY